MLYNFSLWMQSIFIEKYKKRICPQKVEKHLKQLLTYGSWEGFFLTPPVDLHWFFEISIAAFISKWDKNSVIN